MLRLNAPKNAIYYIPSDCDITDVHFCERDELFVRCLVLVFIELDPNSKLIAQVPLRVITGQKVKTEESRTQKKV
jgi:hypothetical protein